MKILNENEGYKQAFYEIAEILGIGARPDSPKDVFEQVMKPMLMNLKKERDALAAENGLAAKAVQTFCDVVGSNTDVIAEEMGIEGAKAILAAMSATGNMPATDAYLNSVRAEGADKVAEYHFVRIEALKEVSRQGHLFHRAAYSDAVNVAHLFRADKHGE